MTNTGYKLRRWIIFTTVLIFTYGCSERETLYYCGNLDKKPMMALGFEPTWFDNRFQINIGYKSIIASTTNNSPTIDKHVKGAEQYRTITAYDSTDRNVLLYFKAMNWDGIQERYILKRYYSSNDPNIAYEVIELVDENQPIEFTWQNVTHKKCRNGIKRLQSMALD